MADGFKELATAREEEYFHKLNQEAAARFKQKQSEKANPRLSPITGKPMEQRNVHGVIIDVCTDSGGIFLDAGELEILVQAFQKDATQQATADSWGKRFLAQIMGL
jgi:hypothetical protein